MKSTNSKIKPVRNAIAFLLCMPCPLLAAVGDVRWVDEFTTGALDSNNWNYDVGFGIDGWGNQELQEYTSDQSNVDVAREQLFITAIRKPDGTGFTSGRINTQGKMEFTYGTLEASIQVPNVADGLWPAFWTMGYNFGEVDWIRAGEIDIMEVGQGLAITENLVNRRVISAAHWEHDEKYATYALRKDTAEDLFLTFRKYTLEWTPDRLATFVDGELIWEMDITEQNCIDCSEFHHPHFVLLNLAVGGLFTSVGGNGSSSAGAASSSSSGLGCVGSSSAATAGVGSSSSEAGCGFEPRTDVSATLPATMIIEYVKLIDNGHTIISTPPEEDNIFDDGAEAAEPVDTPPTPAETEYPSSTPADRDVSPPSPHPETDRADSPTPYPVEEVYFDPTSEPEAANLDEPYFESSPGYDYDEDEYDCYDSESGKGKGKGSRRTRRRLSCGKDGKGGKSSKSSKSSKKGKGSDGDELTSVENGLAVSSSYKPFRSTNNLGVCAAETALFISWAMLAI